MPALSSVSSSPRVLSDVANPLSVPIRVKFLRYRPGSRRKNGSLPSYSMASSSTTGTGTVTTPKWVQKTITIPPQKRGCHLITSKVIFKAINSSRVF